MLRGGRVFGEKRFVTLPHFSNNHIWYSFTPLRYNAFDFKRCLSGTAVVNNLVLTTAKQVMGSSCVIVVMVLIKLELPQCPKWTLMEFL